MPLSLDKLSQRVERCPEKITDYREEAKLIVVEIHGTTLIRIKYDVTDLEGYIRKELRKRKFI